MIYYRDLTKTQAFAEYGSFLTNPLNQYSAPAEDGSIVVECWLKYIKVLPNGTWRYHVYDFHAFTNVAGKRRLLRHLACAVDDNLPIRLVLAQPKKGAKQKVAGVDGSKIPKTISIKKNYVGKVVAFDDDSFTIDFHKQN